VIDLKKKTKQGKKTKISSSKKSNPRINKTPIKAVVLMSGGLDSALAAKLLKNQGIDVYAINFTSPFFNSRMVESMAKEIGIPLKRVELGEKYFEMLRKPKHGYGSALNPCIDCHIFMLKEAKNYSKNIGAKFIFTGEVLGQRPKSQQMRELRLIETESGLGGKLLRPLSAKLLPKTEAQKKKWVDVDMLPEISGRSRYEQMILVKQLGLRRFQSPGGGCLLTCREYAAKVKDTFDHNEKISKDDMDILRIGRHFRLGDVKIIVGKNYQENMELLKRKKKDEYYFEAEDKIPSPITIVQGNPGKNGIETAAQLTAFYSDAKSKTVKIRYGKEKLEKEIKIKIPDERGVEKLRIIWK
jgi:tRNA-specific 2-thiouridylase